MLLYSWIWYAVHAMLKRLWLHGNIFGSGMEIDVNYPSQCAHALDYILQPDPSFMRKLTYARFKKIQSSKLCTIFMKDHEITSFFHIPDRISTMTGYYVQPCFEPWAAQFSHNTYHIMLKHFVTSRLPFSPLAKWIFQAHWKGKTQGPYQSQILLTTVCKSSPQCGF